MVTYRKRRKSHALIIGIVVFVLAMAITFADVYGLSYFDYPLPGDPPPDYRGIPQDIQRTDWPDLASTGAEFVIEIDPELPTATTLPNVPEPATLALFALGCGAFLVARTKRQ